MIIPVAVRPVAAWSAFEIPKSVSITRPSWSNMMFGGLHVAVHHAPLVGVPQGAGRLPENPLDLRHGERLLLVEQILERRARDVLHHEVIEAALALDAVDGDDVGVVELGGGLGLLLEPAHDLVVLGHVGREHF